MQAAHRDPDTVAVILGEGAPLLEAAIPLRVFDLDLSSRGIRPYRVLAVGERLGRLATTAGVRLEAPFGLADVARAGIVVVPGWRAPSGEATSSAVLDALTRAYDDGALIVGLCLGSFVLADAGLLRGRAATTHWRYADELAAYPGVTVHPDVLYVDEGQVVTSAGSAAGLDACLHVVRRQRGADAAAAIARALVVAPHRAGGQTQFVEQPIPRAGRGDPMGGVLDHALAHLDDPGLDVDALAQQAHMSRRTFDRQFRAATGCSPLQWLLQQRVLRAQRALEVSDLGVDEVARSVGFADAVSLRPHFRRVVGVAPQTYRESFRAG